MRKDDRATLNRDLDAVRKHHELIYKDIHKFVCEVLFSNGKLSSKRFARTEFYMNNDLTHILSELAKHTNLKNPESATPTELIYSAFTSETNICKVCGGQTKFQSCKDGFNKFCSSSCRDSDVGKSISLNKSQETNLKKYNVDNVMKSEEIRKRHSDKMKSVDYQARNNKTKLTNNERYSKDWSIQNDEILMKRKDTNISNYGVAEFTLSNSFISEKDKYNNRNSGELWDTFYYHSSDCVKQIGVIQML